MTFCVINGASWFQADKNQGAMDITGFGNGDGQGFVVASVFADQEEFHWIISCNTSSHRHDSYLAFCAVGDNPWQNQFIPTLAKIV